MTVGILKEPFHFLSLIISLVPHSDWRLHLCWPLYWIELASIIFSIPDFHALT